VRKQANDELRNEIEVRVRGKRGKRGKREELFERKRRLLQRGLLAVEEE
jgi:hypothetical protein